MAVVVRLLALVPVTGLVGAACAIPPDRDFEGYKAELDANGYGDRFESDEEAEEFLNNFCTPLTMPSCRI